jgi:hypothetical protein
VGRVRCKALGACVATAAKGSASVNDRNASNNDFPPWIPCCGCADSARAGADDRFSMSCSTPNNWPLITRALAVEWVSLLCLGRFLSPNIASFAFCALGRPGAWMASRSDDGLSMGFGCGSGSGLTTGDAVWAAEGGDKCCDRADSSGVLGTGAKLTDKRGDFPMVAPFDTEVHTDGDLDTSGGGGGNDSTNDALSAREARVLRRAGAVAVADEIASFPLLCCCDRTTGSSLPATKLDCGCRTGSGDASESPDTAEANLFPADRVERELPTLALGAGLDLRVVRSFFSSVLGSVNASVTSDSSGTTGRGAATDFRPRVDRVGVGAMPGSSDSLSLAVDLRFSRLMNLSTSKSMTKICMTRFQRPSLADRGVVASLNKSLAVISGTPNLFITSVTVTEPACSAMYPRISSKSICVAMFESGVKSVEFDQT